jgi:hypothetical protein
MQAETSGGPRKRKDENRAWIRSARLNIRVRPGEKEDLETIAAAMDLSADTLAWAIIAQFLANCRRRKLSWLPGTLAMKRTLEKMGIDTSDMEIRT